MNAKDLMNDVSSRFTGLGDAYKRGEDLASRAADKARNLYDRAEEQLPEGSMKYALFGLAGVTIGAVFYQLGKSRVRRSMLPEALHETRQRVSHVAEQARDSADKRLTLTKEATQGAAQSVEKLDFTPIYKLAKLWLIYKISL